jgi:Outer membrane protein beta-barrel domain
MNTTMRIGVLLSSFTLTFGSLTEAQSLLNDKVFVNVNVGAQTQARSIDNNFSIPIYGQTATVNTTTTIKSGPIFDFSVGYKATKNIGAAIGFTTFSQTGATAGAASVPSPIFFNRPASVTIPESPADRKDRSIYLLLVGFVPIIDKVDLALSIGPSFIRVEQTMITSVSIPAGTQNVNPTIQSQSGTAKGINVGADLSYMFVKQAGAGVFIRYNGGSVDLPSAADLKAGGFQTGVGLRLRF